MVTMQHFLLTNVNAANTVEFVGSTINKDTKDRHGIYLRLRRGMNSGTWFIGVNDAGESIIEMVD